jgi:hypothetical protein
MGNSWAEQSFGKVTMGHHFYFMSQTAMTDQISTILQPLDRIRLASTLGKSLVALGNPMPPMERIRAAKEAASVLGLLSPIRPEAAVLDSVFTVEGADPCAVLAEIVERLKGPVTDLERGELTQQIVELVQESSWVGSEDPALDLAVKALLGECAT